MTNEQQALLDCIQHFKDPETSDLEAALNVIANHAATIARLQQEVARMKREIRFLGLEGAV